MSLTVRLGGYVILLPLVLASFSAAEVSVWLLFSAIASFLTIADFGFGPTFSREIAYGYAGHSLVEPHLDIRLSAIAGDAVHPSWKAITSATAVMLWFYLRLAFVTLLLLAVFGSWAVMEPIGRVAQPQEAWLAWSFVVLSSAVSIYGNAYSSFLIGANRIELQKRWEAVVSGISVLSQLAAVLFEAGLLGLVLVAQICLVANVIVNRTLAMRVSEGRFGNAAQGKYDQRVLRMMWPLAWRTAIGAIMSIGITQGMAVAMANLLVATEAASVQLALRVMQVISQISQVPFYTKIPVLNNLRAGKNIALLATTAAKTMRTSLWLFVVGAIAVGLSVRKLLALLGSQTQFPDQLFWLVLTLAVFSERFGAMHIQLLLTSNKAIAHVANGVAGIIWIVGLFIFFPIIGTLALPISMLIAYVGFYAWYPMIYAHRSLSEVDFWGFEVELILIPFILLTAWIFYLASENFDFLLKILMDK